MSEETDLRLIRAFQREMPDHYPYAQAFKAMARMVDDAYSLAEKTNKQIADLRETIGGCEQQVYEMCAEVSATHTSRYWKEQAEGWRFNHEEAIKRAEGAEAERDANEKRMVLLEGQLSKTRTSVMYLRAILSRIAADDYRGGEPEYIRIAREALKAEGES